MTEFNALAIKILFALSSLLGVTQVPNLTSEWTTTSQWTKTGNINVFSAKSTAIPAQCLSRPHDFISFPSVIHGAHDILIDGKLVQEFGDKTFKTTRSFYGAPVISCKEILNGKELEWVVYSYTDYFARFKFWPTVVAQRPTFNFFAEIFNIIAAGGLLLLGIFASVVYFRKVPHALTFSVAASCLFTSIYFLCTVGGLFGIHNTMASLHKIADLSVWTGIGFLFYGLTHQGLVNRTFFKAYVINLLLALFVIAIGENGDVIQFGTSSPFALTFGSFFVLLLKSGKSLLGKHERTTLTQFLSLLMFITFGTNDMLIVTGLISTPPVLPFGMMFSLLFFALSVNQSVLSTYEERDFLRGNLEQEVERKTLELKNKTILLETAMDNLKHTQAELVHSAKLASLGTLSAGIAHEINNSLNYVNGSISPLEKLVTRVDNEEVKSKMNKLLILMKNGLTLTLEIIKSLKGYTGLNQAQFNNLYIKDIVKSVLTILGSKLRGNISVECNISDSMMVFGSVVGLNQVFMNLISNAVDSMPTGGVLKINAQLTNQIMEVKISDTGSGIPAHLKERIFEPFFTTKEVGQGTGLGLYIVQNEIQKHKGKIRVESEAGKGTTFIIELPEASEVTVAA